jgi:hypothetical protein
MRSYRCANANGSRLSVAGEVGRILRGKDKSVKFLDTKNREYECRVTVADAIELKKMGLDLMGHFNGSIWQTLADDLELLVNAIALTVRSQIEANKIDAAEFARCLGGDGLEAATISLRDAITDFSPPSQRAALKKLFEKTDVAMQVMSSQQLTAIEQLTTELILTSLSRATSVQPLPESLPEISDVSPIAN